MFKHVQTVSADVCNRGYGGVGFQWGLVLGCPLYVCCQRPTILPILPKYIQDSKDVSIPMGTHEVLTVLAHIQYLIFAVWPMESPGHVSHDKDPFLIMVVTILIQKWTTPTILHGL